MGVLYDYFRAADDAAAINLMESIGDGPASQADDLVDAIDLKGIEPTVHLGKLVALAGGIPWQVDLVDTELLWSGTEEGPWLVSIKDAVRDALAEIATGGELLELSAQWGRTEELARPGPLPPEQMLPVIEEVAGLARRAREADEHIYCWCSL